MKATIINIQKYCVHDGPGIRTTVFFKGCPLKCWWCHNPETHSKKNEIMFYEERCVNCGRCKDRCSENAIEIKKSNNGKKYIPIIDYKKCTLCGKCSDICLNSAREYIGREITISELIKELLKDNVFYEQSKGGVTFSGGEPMVYVDFLKELLIACKRHGLHTVIETSGYADWNDFESIKDNIDLFLYDIKLMDNEKHRKYIGVDNKLILENLKKLSDCNKDIIVRMPIITKINDDLENIKKAIDYISTINIKEVNLLPYHKMGMDKYKRINLIYKMNGDETPTKERLEKIADMFRKSNIKVKIGG